MNRTDLDPASQIGALAAVARVAPDEPRVVDAIEQFLPRAVEATTRVGALNAILNSRVSQFRIGAVIANMLDDQHSEVKLLAIATLRRMGPDAVGEARSALVRVQGRAEESVQVKSAARDALAALAR